MGIFQIFVEYFRKFKYPNHLYVSGRGKLPARSFRDDDSLYHAYYHGQLDENEKIKLDTIKFPDFSCNWGQFSKPEDLRFRENAQEREGCYSFTVATSRYKNCATPVHDPIQDNNKHPNYAHVEVRQLDEGEDILSEPPKQRKKLWGRAKRAEYRQNLINCLKIEITAT